MNAEIFIKNKIVSVKRIPFIYFLQNPKPGAITEKEQQ